MKVEQLNILCCWNCLHIHDQSSSTLFLHHECLVEVQQYLLIVLLGAVLPGAASQVPNCYSIWYLQWWKQFHTCWVILTHAMFVAAIANAAANNDANNDENSKQHPANVWLLQLLLRWNYWLTKPTRCHLHHSNWGLHWPHNMHHYHHIFNVHRV